MLRIQNLNRTQIAVVVGQGLSFLLIITFIFATQRYGLLSSFAGTEASFSLETAYVSSCLVGLVGIFSIWITLHYLGKSNAMREMVVVCAWTNQVKLEGEWVSFRDFLSHQLGYAVSHGICGTKLDELRREVDEGWDEEKLSEQSKPMGMYPVEESKPSPLEAPAAVLESGNSSK